MPCSDGGPDREMYENKKDYGIAVTYDQMSRAVACEMAKLLEEHGLIDYLSTTSQLWVINHKILDSKRKK